METLRLVRRDALPEDSTYYDDGCEVAPSCLACPLVRCRYDYPQGLETVRDQARVNRTMQLRDLGYMDGEIADMMQSSVRSVYRRLATARRQSADVRLYEVKTNRGIVVLIGESNYGTA
ncbi:hypothetical protein LCGC14_1076700 [marine sediment metagenome]|uniref:Uncharacterized protein n=1 Tax=marine sediment metagenome TaxID=412755 RepID=A0A0F9N3Z7_9ZZZZ